MAVFTVETQITHQYLMRKSKYYLAREVLRLLNDCERLRKLAMRHANGAPVFALDGTMLDDKGGRSVFDDVDA